MTRSELKMRIASRLRELSAEDAAVSVDVILEAIAASLIVGKGVQVRGFGTFSAAYRPSRTGRNPRTGASVRVPAKHSPRFRPTGELRNRVDRCASPAARRPGGRRP